ncbi:hypothetical protein SNEBB_007689 [Seison nebaliae]|nr:hypothetical protein SNEBB_007689 [Seison nebaliae]
MKNYLPQNSSNDINSHNVVLLSRLHSIAPYRSPRINNQPNNNNNRYKRDKQYSLIPSLNSTTVNEKSSKNGKNDNQNLKTKSKERSRNYDNIFQSFNRRSQCHHQKSKIPQPMSKNVTSEKVVEKLKPKSKLPIKLKNSIVHRKTEESSDPKINLESDEKIDGNSNDFMENGKNLRQETPTGITTIFMKDDEETRDEEERRDELLRNGRNDSLSESEKIENDEKCGNFLNKIEGEMGVNTELNVPNKEKTTSFNELKELSNTLNRMITSGKKSIQNNSIISTSDTQSNISINSIHKTEFDDVKTNVNVSPNHSQLVNENNLLDNSSVMKDSFDLNESDAKYECSYDNRSSIKDDVDDVPITATTLIMVQDSTLRSIDDITPETNTSDVSSDSNIPMMMVKDSPFELEKDSGETNDRYDSNHKINRNMNLESESLTSISTLPSSIRRTTNVTDEDHSRNLDNFDYNRYAFEKRRLSTDNKYDSGNDSNKSYNKSYDMKCYEDNYLINNYSKNDEMKMNSNELTTNHFEKMAINHQKNHPLTCLSYQLLKAMKRLEANSTSSIQYSSENYKENDSERMCKSIKCNQTTITSPSISTHSSVLSILSSDNDTSSNNDQKFFKETENLIVNTKEINFNKTVEKPVRPIARVVATKKIVPTNQREDDQEKGKVQYNNKKEKYFINSTKIKHEILLQPPPPPPPSTTTPSYKYKRFSIGNCSVLDRINGYERLQLQKEYVHKKNDNIIQKHLSTNKTISQLKSKFFEESSVNSTNKLDYLKVNTSKINCSTATSLYNHLKPNTTIIISTISSYLTTTTATIISTQSNNDITVNTLLLTNGRNNKSKFFSVKCPNNMLYSRSTTFRQDNPQFPSKLRYTNSSGRKLPTHSSMVSLVHSLPEPPYSEKPKLTFEQSNKFSTSVRSKKMTLMNNTSTATIPSTSSNVMENNLEKTNTKHINKNPLRRHSIQRCKNVNMFDNLQMTNTSHLSQSMYCKDSSKVADIRKKYLAKQKENDFKKNSLVTKKVRMPSTLTNVKQLTQLFQKCKSEKMENEWEMTTD